jgi:hypothetical protein
MNGTDMRSIVKRSKSGGKPTFLTCEVSAVEQFPGSEALSEAIRLGFGKLEVGKAGFARSLVSDASC